MENQEVFDKVYKHFVTQCVQAVGDKGCSYRGDNDTKCAVGLLMSDKDYRLEMEGQSVHADIVKKSFKGFNIALLSSLQDVHDNIASWNTSKNCFSQAGHDYMEDIANVYKLKYKKAKK